MEKKILWVLLLIALIITIGWLFPSHTYMTDKGCLRGKPAMRWSFIEVCKK